MMTRTAMQDIIPGFSWLALTVYQVMTIPLASCQTYNATTPQPDVAIVDRECNWTDRSNGQLRCQVQTATTNLQHVIRLIGHAANTTNNVHRLTINFVPPANGSVTSGRRLVKPIHNTSVSTNVSANSDCNRLCEIKLIDYPWSVLPVTIFSEVADMLRQVTINTADASLSIDVNAIGQLHDVVQLDLTGSKMTTIAEREFCDLSKLIQLNMSSNLFDDSSALGFGSGCHSPDTNTSTLFSSCAVGLQVLDASRNRFSSVPVNSFCALTNLTSLSLSNNQLKEINEGAFTNLNSLKHLDLSKNELIRFQRHLWRDVPDIIDLNLFDNSLLRLNNQTFEHLSNLEKLNLNDNKIDTVDANTFHKMANLRVLLLESNRIFRFTPRTFEALTRLIKLSLRNNNIESINGTTFAGLDGLDYLELGYNELTAVEPDAFSKCCRRMRKLSLHGNGLQTVPTLSSLPGIEILSLSVNPYITISNDSFTGLKNITKIELDRTDLTSLPDTIFEGLVTLQTVTLAMNPRIYLPSNIFSSNTNLRELDLEESYLSTIPDLSNTSLEILRLVSNRITSLNTSLLPATLQNLDVSYNQIGAIGPNGFARFCNLQIINLMNNLISSTSNLYFPSNLSRLVLAQNMIGSMDAIDFRNATSLASLILDNNRLLSLDSSVLTVMSSTVRNGVLKISIAGNPFTCDCQMAWIKDVDAANRVLGNVIVLNYDKATCCVSDIRKPQCHLKRARKLEKIYDVNINSFLCPFRHNGSFYGNYCFNQSMDAQAVCHLPCPQMCQCYYKSDRTSIVTVCSDIALSEVPANISTNSVVIYLDGNRIDSLVRVSFKMYGLVQKLFLNGTYVQAISNSTFANMRNLRQLYLEANLLQVLPIGVFDGLPKLEMLNLSGNLLSVLPDGVFYLLPSLTSLQLTNNLLVNLPSVSVKNETSIESLGLQGNPWACNCQNMATYSQWQQSNILNTVDDQRLMCHTSGIGKGGNDMNNYLETADRVENNTDGNSNSKIMKMADYGFLYCSTEPAISITLPVASATSLMVLLIIASILIFVYRYEMQVLLYSHCSFRLSDDVADDEDGCDRPLYDAFVAYSNEDELFVAKELLPRLEGPLVPSTPYRLCLHQRDFAVGAFISESIGEAVNRSRRTIVVLSRHFVASNWCRYEFKTAHYQMLQDRRKRVIVVVLADGDVKDITDGELDAEMKLYLKTNTYLKWGDHLFWQKLYYAMPRPKNAGSSENI